MLLFCALQKYWHVTADNHTHPVSEAGKRATTLLAQISKTSGPRRDVRLLFSCKHSGSTNDYGRSVYMQM